MVVAMKDEMLLITGINQILCMESLDDDKTWRDNDGAGDAAYEK